MDLQEEKQSRIVTRTGGKIMGLFAVCIVAVVGALLCYDTARAGNIDGASGYAWGENLGWVNFAMSQGNVTVSDTGVTGYAWSSTAGWINLGPFQNASGVTNAGGVLGGYAWTSSLGWISMQGATIGAGGVLTGIVGESGTRAGRINFSCAMCRVQTTWVPKGSTAAPSQQGATRPSRVTTVAPSEPAQPATTEPDAPGRESQTETEKSLFDVTVTNQNIGASRPLWQWITYVLGGVVALCLALWFIVLRKKRRKRQEEAKKYNANT